MKKALAIFFIALVILALWSFDHSFMIDNTIGRVSGTSAVVFTKTDDVSVRVRFSVIANPGTTATITFSNGTQAISSTGPVYFNILLPKTASPFDRSGGIVSPAGILLNLQKPFGAAILSETTITDFASAFNSSRYNDITIYWFRIDGKAAVTVNSFGVGV